MATRQKEIHAAIAGSSSFEGLCKFSHLLFWTSISVLLAAQFQRLQMRARNQVLVHGCLGCRMTLGNQLSRQFLKRLVSFQGRFRKDCFFATGSAASPFRDQLSFGGFYSCGDGTATSLCHSQKQKYVLQRPPGSFWSASNR